MTNFIPIFPLNIVAFPTEQINLHIFEPRYKQLIHECYTQSKQFCLPVVIDGLVQEIATVMQVDALHNEYITGELDISCTTLYACRILEIIKEVPEKLYSGSIVMHLPIPTFTKVHFQASVIAKLKQLHIALQVHKKYKKSADELTSFDIAHHVGFTLQQEYQVLCIESENQRLQYISNHLDNYLATLENKKTTIDRILLNGHFRNLSLDNFDFKK
jgi:uncharacterized protein